jgi:hypothetical protein
MFMNFGSLRYFYLQFKCLNFEDVLEKDLKPLLPTEDMTVLLSDLTYARKGYDPAFPLEKEPFDCLRPTPVSPVIDGKLNGFLPGSMDSEDLACATSFTASCTRHFSFLLAPSFA